jgi:hypothetical protein
MRLPPNQTLNAFLMHLGIYLKPADKNGMMGKSK